MQITGVLAKMITGEEYTDQQLVDANYHAISKSSIKRAVFQDGFFHLKLNIALKDLYCDDESFLTRREWDEQVFTGMV